MKKLLSKLNNSPINYFSDLFIVSMVLFWIVDNIYETVIATAVTVSSIVLSFTTGTSCFEVSMWSSIGNNVAIPLASGGALWMIKNAVVHAISNSKGKHAEYDFPSVDSTEELDEMIAREENND